jgi:coproporphyrinogen III oxidase-like Fe-S oxidoreductase
MVDELGATLELVRELFPVREISVETNPNHLDEATIGALKKMGVNRLSVGVQSFQDPLLKQMDRFEKYGSGAAISARLKEISGIFDTLNVDMIFNFPSQTPRLLAEDLKTLLEIRVDQVTYYPLMLSAYTRDGMEKTLGQVSRKQEGDLYRQIVSTLEPAYGRSSAWCFSLAGSKSIIDEYIVDYDEYAGLGSGAIGYLGGACYANSFDISHYIAELDQGRLPLLARRDFGAVELMRYHWLMKLFGMKTSLGNLFSPVRRLVYPILLLDMAFFFLVGAWGYGKGEIYLTRRGAYLWVVMMREFFTAVNNFRDYCRSPKS